MCNYCQKSYLIKTFFLKAFVFPHFVNERENELLFAIFTLTTLAVLVNSAASSLSGAELL